MVIYVLVGSYVIRKKYKGDILFKIKSIISDTAVLSGVYMRLVATAPVDDLLEITKEELSFFRNKYKEKKRNIEKSIDYNKNHITGKILHIDSELSYLIKCHKVYQELGLYSICVLLDAPLMSQYILDLVRDYQVDIVVLTGHDSYNKKGKSNLNNYQNTKYYMEAISKLRKIYSLDDLYIFAGACGSNFEALIASGANAASSPERVNIDAYDPCICAVKASTTPFDQIISFDSIWAHSLTKEKGISGIESYGKMRILRRWRYMIIEKAYAKINLGLEVGGIRNDGYHCINTIMVPIDLYDEISVEEIDNGILLIDNTNLKAEDNFAYKAAKLFINEYNINKGVRIILKKNIPTEAGLGGGSADASAVLRAMNKLFETKKNEAELAQLSSKLGSDMPFCVYSRLAYCTGRGEEVIPLIADYERFNVAIVKPPYGLSTKDVYSACEYTNANLNNEKMDYIKEALIEGDLKLLGESIFNDLTKGAFILNEDLKQLVTQIQEMGYIVGMTGSGTALYVFSLENDFTKLDTIKYHTIIKTKLL